MNKKKVTDWRELMKDWVVLREIVIAIMAMIHELTYPFLFLRLR